MLSTLRSPFSRRVLLVAASKDDRLALASPSVRREELPRYAARQRSSEPGTPLSERHRILFLGNSYNPISLACLHALLGLGHDTYLVVYDPVTRGLRRLMREGLKSRGWRFLLQRGARLLHYRARIALRRVGVPLSRFTSLSEFCGANRLQTIPCLNPNSAEF